MSAEPREVQHQIDRADTSGERLSPSDIVRTFSVTLGPSLVLELFAVLSTLSAVSGWALRPRKGMGSLLRTLAILGAAVPWMYVFIVRPWHQRWGATEEEACEQLPGDELVPRSLSQMTRAITIKAPTKEVWAWLMQFGQDRGGLYSYDWLENLANLDIHSVDVVPELQNLKMGDLLRFAPERFGPEAGLRVVRIERDRALILHQPTDPDTKRPTDRHDPNLGILKEQDQHSTRLLVRSRVDGRPRPLIWLFYTLPVEIPHFVMERAMLKGIKERAERAQATRMANFALPGDAG